VKPVVEQATPAKTAAARADLPGKIAFVRGKDTWLYWPRTGETRKLIPGTTEARWSPDGTSIAFTRADGLYLANSDGTAERRVATGSDFHGPVWAPDGTRIAWQQDAAPNQAAGDIWVLELGSGEARKVARGASPAWAPDSKRLAYVTVPGDDSRRRSELRLVNYAGQHDWVVVKDLPENIPAIGIPGNEQSRANLDHLMSNPFWDRDGHYVYVASYVLDQAEAEFFIWERADSTKGGSTFLGQLNGGDAFPSPDRQAVLVGSSNAKGESWFVARALDGQNQAWAWAATRPNATDVIPAWAPDSKAVAYYHCDLDHPERCNLQLLTPQGGSVLLRDVVGAAPNGANPPSLDWGRDG
jgi:Tol biopolymer transport system component